MSQSRTKLRSIPTIAVEPATSNRWPDVAALFAGHGDRGCWCQYWRHPSSAYRNAAPGFGKVNLQQQVQEGPAPGMLAYVDGEPAGWLGFWPRERMDRLTRSRTIPKVDNQPVWSIVCFMVRTGFRRKGIAAALLNGAIAYARNSGIPALEAYPIDPQGTRVDATFAYVGLTTMFESAGFVAMVETSARSAGRPRLLMRLTL